MASLFKKFPDHEVVWYFDPNKPAQSVGEGSTPALPTDLGRYMNFNYGDLKKVNGTYKNGILKENWGTREQSFMHPFMPPEIGMHFSATNIQDYIYENLKDQVSIIESEVDPYSVDSDFVLNASGTPKNFDDFNLSKYVPVNSAHVVQCAWDAPEFDYTLTIAGKHGWIFGIPLQNRCSIGYIYNNTISSIEDLQEDMQKIFDDYGLTPSSVPNNINFNNYYRKVNYEDGGRIVHNGNASFFLEPLEATSFATARQIYDQAARVWAGIDDHEQANDLYLKMLEGTEAVLMLHYVAGSAFNTPFWEYAKDLGMKRLDITSRDADFIKIYNIAKHEGKNNIALGGPAQIGYGPWSAYSHGVNLLNLGIVPLIDKLIEQNNIV